MTQLSLFETSKQVSLTDTVVAVNFKGRWEIYTIDYTNEDGTLERFSHYATPAESLACYFGRSL